MWLRLPALALAPLALALLLAAGPGTRLELWPFQTGFLLLRIAAYAGLAAAALALVALAVPASRRRAPRALVAALAIGLACAFVPWHFQSRARAVPPIHDITTDTEQPPAFVAVLPLRSKAPNPPEYAGREVGEQQRRAYPDIQPLVLGVPPSLAFVRARDAAEAMGWRIVAADPAAGRIEATARTPWFGFRDDVVVRITPAERGSRIDVRSKSRVGRSDAGANAERIRAYLERLRK